MHLIHKLKEILIFQEQVQLQMFWLKNDHVFCLCFVWVVWRNIFSMSCVWQKFEKQTQENFTKLSVWCPLNSRHNLLCVQRPSFHVVERWSLLKGHLCIIKKTSQWWSWNNSGTNDHYLEVVVRPGLTVYAFRDSYYLHKMLVEVCPLLVFWNWTC